MLSGGGSELFWIAGFGEELPLFFEELPLFLEEEPLFLEEASSLSESELSESAIPRKPVIFDSASFFAWAAAF